MKNRIVLFIGALILATVLVLIQIHSAKAVWGQNVVTQGNKPDSPYPYSVILIDQNKQSCSGTLINSQWIVTADHCIYNSASYLQGGLNNFFNNAYAEFNVSDADNEDGDEKYFVDYIPHENLDVAVLKLSSPVNNTPIQLGPIDPKFGDSLTFLGWGGNSPSQLSDGQLRELSTHVINDCGGIGFNNLCAFADIGMICQGDSGGTVKFPGSSYLEGVIVLILDLSPPEAGVKCGSTIGYVPISAARDLIESTFETTCQYQNGIYLFKEDNCAGNSMNVSYINGFGVSGALFNPASISISYGWSLLLIGGPGDYLCASHSLWDLNQDYFNPVPNRPVSGFIEYMIPYHNMTCGGKDLNQDTYLDPGAQWQLLPFSLINSAPYNPTNTVTLYKESNFSGDNCYVDELGAYNICDNNNDFISSVKVTGGSVLLYKDGGQTGPTLCLKQDESNLAYRVFSDNSSADNNVSSYSLHDDDYCGDASFKDDAATLYEHSNNAGSQCIIEGHQGWYNIDQYCPGFNDKASSLNLIDNVSLWIFTDANNEGAYTCLSSDNSNFNGVNLSNYTVADNKVSSVYLLHNGSCDTTTATDFPVLGVVPPNTGSLDLFYTEIGIPHSLPSMPNFSGYAPLQSGFTPNISVNVKSRVDDFALEFIGCIEIPATGDYTFYSSSDDGSLVFVNNTLVVSNDGLHGNIEKNGNITLTRGQYPFKVQFYESGGDEIITVMMQGPGITKQVIPNDWLSYLPECSGPNPEPPAATPTATNTDTPVATPTPTVTPLPTATNTPTPTATPSLILLSQGRPITASSQKSGYQASKANDGNTTSYWEANNGFPAWITVNLGSVKQVSKVVLGVAWTRTENIAVLVSNDNVNFTSIVPATNYVLGTVDITFSTVSARYVKLVVNSNSVAPAAQLHTFEVWGISGPTATPTKTSTPTPTKTPTSTPVGPTATNTPTITPSPTPTTTSTGVCNTGTELLTTPWYLQRSTAGGVERYQSISATALQGKTSICITYNLYGLTALGGDASAIIFDQNGWQYVSLSNYGVNGFNGVQYVTIPLSHFTGLNPNTSVGTLHTRFWYSTGFTVDITSIKAVP